MKLTKEEAIRYHREMWADMLWTLGDNPNKQQRENFKREWIKKFIANNYYFKNTCGWIWNDCFLCEYASRINYCESCPIDWGGYKCECGNIDWRYSPVSKILALPERKIDDK